MTSNNDRRDQEWLILYKRLISYLSKFGTNNAFGEGDFWIRDEQLGATEHVVFLFNLDLLTMPVIMKVQQFLADFPDWTVVLVVDVIGKEKEWPDMGVTIRSHEIVDGLVRSYLPERLQRMRIPGSRRYDGAGEAERLG